MIKEEIRSLIFNLIPKLDKSAKYHPRFLDAAIEKTLNEMLWELFAIDPLALQRYVVQYGYVTAVAVALEGTSGLYYSTLPAKIVPLPRKGSGVIRIHTPIQAGIKFYPMDAREHDLIRNGSYFNTVTDKIGFSVNQTRIEYYNMTAAIVTSGVRMDIIQPFSQYADGDTVLLPELRDKDGETFESRVLRKLAVIPPVNLSEDTDETTKTKE
jgi:hypothetical protein